MKIDERDPVTIIVIKDGLYYNFLIENKFAADEFKNILGISFGKSIVPNQKGFYQYVLVCWVINLFPHIDAF